MPKIVGKSGGFTKESEDLPSGYVKIAIEHANIVDFPMINGDVP
jgi:hypothetical protein